MAVHFPFFYNGLVKRNQQGKDGRNMALLDVKNVKKIYTTRFGGNQVEALRDVTFSV